MFKFCSLILLCAGMACADDFITGQAARAVIGQTTFTENRFGTSDTKFGGIGGLALAGNTLFVTDANRIGLVPISHRVLVFQNIDQQLPAGDASIPPNSGLCPVCGGQAQVVMGQVNFEDSDYATGQNRMRLPTAVASDGVRVAVADTSNNRVLLWNSIPSVNGSNADVVLGQTSFTANRPGVGASKFRGPQGVWIQDGRLFVADTGNNRVLIWNSFPTQNGQAANVVLGQPNFDAAPPPNLTDLGLPGSATTMINPTGVSSDGVRLIVSDLGSNRVLIYNTIPTENQKAADVVVGQKDFTKTFSNQSPDLCAPASTDADGNSFYPARCAATMNFPRHAISDGQRLFVADTGNDRVLIFNQIPTTNGARADVILGQRDEFSSGITSDDTHNASGTFVTPTPTSLAWNGRDLYVADPTDYRILVFSPGNQSVGIDGIVNSASRAIFSTGTFSLGGAIAANDTVTLTIGGVDYKRTIVAEDTIASLTSAFVQMINTANDGAGDANVRAFLERDGVTIRVISRRPGIEGTDIALRTAVSAAARITAAASGLNLTGGGDASIVAPGTLVTIKAAPGASLAETEVHTPSDADELPLELGGVEVYVNGFRAPLLMVSPTEISTQIPYEMNKTSTFATGSFTLVGGVTAGERVILHIGDQTYQHTNATGDTTLSIATDLTNAINSSNNGQGDPSVIASLGPDNATIFVIAKRPGAVRALLSTEVLSTATVVGMSVIASAFNLRGGGDGSLSLVVRFTRADNSVSVTNAIGLQLRAAAPGLFACDAAFMPECRPGGEEPRALLAYHASSFATATVSVDGVPAAGDVITLTIGDVPVTVTAVDGDSRTSIRDKLIDAVNASPEVVVTASRINQFTRLRLTAKVPGPEGNGTPLISQTTTTSLTSSLTVSATNITTCCASVAGRQVTADNPAVPGETIVVYATGMGMVVPEQDNDLLTTGRKYAGTALNTADTDVSSLVDQTSAQVLSAGAKPGAIGIYEIVLEISVGHPGNPRARTNISQDVLTSNTATLPIAGPQQK